MLLFWLAIVPAFAQEGGEEPADSSNNQSVPVGQSTAPSQAVDIGAVLAQWGPKPTTQDDMNRALAADGS